jgi:hypothetical protein
MAFGLRDCLVLSVFVAAGLFALADEACSEDPVNAQVGGYTQPCFPGDTCNAPFVCYPYVFDGGVSDGGQCLEAVPASDAMEESNAGDSPSDVHPDRN